MCAGTLSNYLKSCQISAKAGPKQHSLSMCILWSLWLYRPWQFSQKVPSIDEGAVVSHWYGRPKIPWYRGSRILRACRIESSRPSWSGWTGWSAELLQKQTFRPRKPKSEPQKSFSFLRRSANKIMARTIVCARQSCTLIFISSW